MINYYVCCKKTKEEFNELSEVRRWNITFYFFQNDLFMTDVTSCNDHLKEKKKKVEISLHIKMKNQMFSISFQKYSYGPSSFCFSSLFSSNNVVIVFSPNCLRIVTHVCTIILYSSPTFVFHFHPNVHMCSIEFIKKSRYLYDFKYYCYLIQSKKNGERL